jgi:hypothetical protein
LRTDDHGRLIFLGGHGLSESFDGSPAITYGNNEAWHDDVSDGPVTAKVRFEGQDLPVDPAWVVTAPPNFGPRLKSVRTLWDVMRDVSIQAGKLPTPIRPSFQRDIRPIFERLSGLQWVNAGYAALFGWKGLNELGNRAWLERLGRNAPETRELRRSIANQFRVFARDAWSHQQWPPQYGDAMNIPAPESPRENVALSTTQLNMLQQWAAGEFEEDLDLSTPPSSLDEVPVTDQPAMLDRAALEFCLGDAFHPGCEMTWPMRTPSMYMAPFRILHAPAGAIESSFGASLMPDVLHLPNGPVAAQFPGGITRWMAIPWQTDSASCRSGYEPAYDPYLPTFWPARVPNQVLTEANYEIVMDTEKPLGERLQAFAARAAWIRPLGSKSYTDQIQNMIHHFGDMGVVEHRDGPGDQHFPAEIQVEILPHHTHRRLLETKEPPNAADRVNLLGTDKARRFPRGIRRW